MNENPDDKKARHKQTGFQVDAKSGKRCFSQRLLIDKIFKFRPGLEAWDFFRLDFKDGTGLRVASCARGTLRDAERSEPNQGNGLTFFERGLDAVNKRVDGFFRGGFRDARIFCNFFY